MHSVRISMRLLAPTTNGKIRRNITKMNPCMCAQNSIKLPKSESQQQQQMPPALANNQTHTAKMIKSNLLIDWEAEMQQIEAEERESERSILAPVDDENKIHAEPMLRPTYNLAAYVQKSETLQQLIKLGVDLSEVDRKRAGHFIVNLDFKTDIEPYIIYMTTAVGIAIDKLGKLFTKNPKVLREHLDDIQTRINYMGLKRFTSDEIASIVTRNAFWLSHSTRDIDARLGFFQKHFELNGSEVRLITVACPKLITHNPMDVEQISFAMREECDFSSNQIKQLVLKCPKLWRMHRYFLMKNYDFIIDNMKIENSQLVLTPLILEQRLFRIKERHGFLKKIGRAQYNPKLPLYISLDNLCKGTDDQFAVEIAKRTYEEYDQYLRTL